VHSSGVFKIFAVQFRTPVIGCGQVMERCGLMSTWPCSRQLTFHFRVASRSESKKRFAIKRGFIAFQSPGMKVGSISSAIGT